MPNREKSWQQHVKDFRLTTKIYYFCLLSVGGSKDGWLPCRDPVRSKHTINKGETKMGSINLKENNLTVFFYERWSRGISSLIFLLGNFLMTMLLLLKCWSDDEEQHEVNCGISVFIILRISPVFSLVRCVTRQNMALLSVILTGTFRNTCFQKVTYTRETYTYDVHSTTVSWRMIRAERTTLPER